MTMTMTTLTDDVSNNCQSSGPVGVSDGVMKSRKTSEICSSDERNLLNSLERRSETTVCRDECKVNKKKKRLIQAKFPRTESRLSWSYPVDKFSAFPSCLSVINTSGKIEESSFSQRVPIKGLDVVILQFGQSSPLVMLLLLGVVFGGGLGRSFVVVVLCDVGFFSHR